MQMAGRRALIANAAADNAAVQEALLRANTAARNNDFIYRGNLAANEYARTHRVNKKARAAMKKRKAYLLEWSTAVEKHKKYAKKEWQAALKRADKMSLLVNDLSNMKKKCTTEVYAGTVASDEADTEDTDWQCENG